ncbi:MAG TPA: efflux transporter outer membrane subunit [Verrucomicrobiae bacterium]|jgi:multidrug efflux system outer membrane protein|nr:efflux transporter outer membrane subunit [Verrucomicrobiae bacterium]
MKKFVFSAAALACFALAGCAVGPNYQRPSAPAPAPDAYKTEAPWRTAAPKDSLPKGAWWEVFNDPELNAYEQQLLTANQSLLAAKDRLDEARSLARVTSAAFFPQASVDPNASRNRYSSQRPEVLTLGNPLTQSTYEIPFYINWEPDLFGRIRRNLEASNANLQATAADMYNVDLVLTSELAADYFSLRELDAEYQVVLDSVQIQQKGLQLVEYRHNGGVASGLDLAQQQTLLDSTQTQLYLVKQQRDQFEHAIAVLTGNPASSFSVPIKSLTEGPVPVPLGVPSDLLERRPDIAIAERQMAQQNALVGVAKAAFYPQLTLSGSGGFQSTSIASLISAPTAIWSFGGDLLEPVVNGGRNRANLAFARQSYSESVANYRETVLVAFQQVEDGLTGLNQLAQAESTQNTAVADAQRALEIANNRYVGGVTTYLDVITAQSTLLTNQRLSTQLLGQQMVTEVALVKALGGGWDASQIQNEQVHPKAIQAIQQ